MLKGRNAVVTGSTSGIGLGIARALAKDGANVVINGFGPADAIEKERAGIEKEFGVKAIYSGADMTKPAEIAAMIKTAESKLGSCDILVNNAGIQHVAPVHEFPPEKFRLILAVMLEAPFRLARAALPHMYEQGFGRIVNISSVHGLRASPFKSAYVAAKHGLEGLSKVIALEGGGRGVTSNTICPAYVRTPLVEKQIADQARIHGISEDRVVEEIMLTEPSIKRLIEPAEVAELVAYLCSAPASFANGSSYLLDGGWSAR
jgi:3-hydroxybutyrate dehydrogenase